MNKKLLPLFALSLLIGGAKKQATAAERPVVIEAPSTSRDRFGFGIPLYLNASASFRARRTSNPGAAPGAVPTLADGRVDRTYDDGFNRANSAGNPALGPGGTPVTTFFGFQSDMQVANAAGAGTLALHSVQLNGGSYHNDLRNKPLPGIEFTYRRDLSGQSRWATYLEGGVGYQNFTWREDGTAGSTASVITDTFALNGVNLPAGTAPYSGPFTPVPGAPAIGSTPTRTTANMAAAVTGRREISLHAIQLRLAPGVEWLSQDRKWSVGAQAGLNLGVGFSELDYNEQINIAGLPTISQSGGSSESHAWAGLFTALRLGRRISDRWRGHVELRHQFTGQLNHNGAGRSAEINLSDGFGVSLGISRSF